MKWIKEPGRRTNMKRLILPLTWTILTPTNMINNQSTYGKLNTLLLTDANFDGV